MVDTPETSPRGTDRVRRKARQEAHAQQSVHEAATLIPPRGEEKKAQIEANKAAQIARFGDTGTSRRKAAQAENRAAAAVQDALLAGTTVLQQAKLVPGEQVDARTARLIAKAQDREERDDIERAAKAAGLAVRATLRDQPLRHRRSLARRIAQHNSKNAASAAQT